MVLKLQTESPADSDIFKGESHEKVAEKMAEVIEKSDVNIIGLEGELGSGKSTILHFLQKKLNNNLRLSILMQNVITMVQLKKH